MEKISIFTILVLVVIFISGCTVVQECGPLHGEVPQDIIDLSGSDFEDIETKQFTSVESLKTFINDNQGSSAYYGRPMMNVRMDMDVEAVAMDVSDGAAKPVSEGSSANDFSETNNQVQGIDEADIIKTDGNYIYTITGKTLFLIDAYPGEDAKVLSKINFEDRPESLFINGDKLVVFGTVYDRSIFSEYDIRGGMTYFYIYDISDKAKPSLEKEYVLEGNYFNGRMTGDYVYIMTNSYLDSRIVHPLPIILEDDVLREVPLTSISYFDIPYNSPSFVNVNALDLNSLELTTESIIVENSNNMYMSEENLYLTYTEYINEYQIEKQILLDLTIPYLSDEEKALVEKIKAADSDLLSKAEKDQKVFQIIERLSYTLDEETQEDLQDEAEKEIKKVLEDLGNLEFTVINKVSLDGSKITPVANGKVPGHIINQFSLDESDGNLRIATTLNPRWSSYLEERKDSTNNIYVLDEDLEQIGELTGLAEDERIYSTRFMGDRLYLVTFKQIDPFFVIDLSNPKQPEVLGELKIPGFSRYLHPYDENTIIGIGQDATEEGRAEGLKISLFDVTDVEKPTEVATYITESKYSGSTALYEHKAFLFDKEKNLMVIPAYSYNYKNSESYNGAFVFNISKEDIKLRGLIDHSANANKWSAAVQRSLFIENLLYTKSENLLRINDLDDLSSVNKVELLSENSEVVIY